MKRPKDVFKIIIIGSPGSGKTNYCKRWTKNTFTDEYEKTIVSEYNFKDFKYEEKLYHIHLCDLAGNDNDGTVTKIFCKNIHGCIIMFDSKDLKSKEEYVNKIDIYLI